MNLPNKEVLPSSNPYNVIEEDCGYSFVTETGCKYLAYFTKCDNELPIYSFSFEKEDGVVSVYDARVRRTICNILERFFKREENALLYTCDVSDGRQAARQRLFKIWFGPYEFLADVEDANEENIFIRLFVLKENPLKHIIIERFKELASILVVS